MFAEARHVVSRPNEDSNGRQQAGVFGTPKSWFANKA